jgi:hypothetical protein
MRIMADKTKTIKGATDKELDELLSRLRKENEVQNLIADLKRKSSTGYIPYDQGLGISTETPIESMYHFGVPGMKWGRRKGNSSKNSNGENHSEDYKKKVLLKNKNIKEMSNQELKTFNERLQLERQYKDLTKSEKSAGKKFVADIITSAAKQTASVYVAKYMAKGVEQLIKKAIKTG